MSVVTGVFNGTPGAGRIGALRLIGALLMERPSALEVYTEVVLPALLERLDSALPEFGWRRDRWGWVATDQEFTHRVFGVRADRVVAHGSCAERIPRPWRWVGVVDGVSQRWGCAAWGGVRPYGGGACPARGSRPGPAASGRGHATDAANCCRRCSPSPRRNSGASAARTRVPTLRSVVSRPARSSVAGSVCSPSVAL